MIQLVMASTLYQVASLAAMVDHGALEHLGPSEDPVSRRVLVLADGSQRPELTTPLQESTGFEELASRFDAVVDLGALLWPRRPRQFNPRAEELVTWQRLLRSHWGLGEERVSLVLESLQVNPAAALARVFHDSPLSVHADGLMSYGPTRVLLAPSISQRLDALVYLDLIPGLRPVYLSEHLVTRVPVPARALGSVLEQVSAQIEPSPEVSTLMRSSVPTSLLLGQYLVDLGILDAAEQAELDRAMVAQARHDGAKIVAYKPHPAAGLGGVTAVESAAREAGLELVLVRDSVPAEVLMSWLRPVSVLSSFSTSLFTARALFDIPATAIMAQLVSQRLTPFQNSNRLPVVLAEALLGRHSTEPMAEHHELFGERLQALVESVAYCMQPELLPELRTGAERFLANEPALRDLYVKQRRLRSLGLPHAPPRSSSPAGTARLALEKRLGPEQTQRAVTLVRSLQKSPRRAAKTVGQRLVTWSQAPRSTASRGR